MKTRIYVPPLRSRWKCKAALLTAVFFCLSLPAAFCAADSPPATTARHILLFIGDGMSLESEIAASRYLDGGDSALSFQQLPHQAEVATWDVNTYNYWAAALGRPAYRPEAIEPSLGYDPARGGRQPSPLAPELPGGLKYATSHATDSAAAATAWATGRKTGADRIAWLPGEGGAVQTIAELLRANKGFAIGVVSTVPFSHATPAAHVSHNIDRSRYKAIAAEILTRTRPEVVIGAGHPGPAEALFRSYTYIGAELYADFKSGRRSGDYLFIESVDGTPGAARLQAAAEKAAAAGQKLFGLFGENHFGFPEPQHRPGAPRIVQADRADPTLAQAVTAALTVLRRRPQGFFLMAEQGDIDWANHANDYRHMVGTVIDLHEAVQAAIDFVDQPGDDLDWSNTLLVVTADHANGGLRSRARLNKGELPRQTASDNPFPGMPYYTYPDAEVTWAATGHTNELVRLYAIGTGSELFQKHAGQWYPGTRILDNTQIFHVLMEAAGESQPSPLQLQRAPQAELSRHSTCNK